MQLPFVLQSAEAMKAAVAHLEPHMPKTEGESTKGRIVLATVKGDVHDIGKNLVDIILTNNGYEVFNLGIKVPLNDMVQKAREVGADAIGMSGLLVKSTLIMRENLEELNAAGPRRRCPVILGGAALTRTYVERDLREVYDGRVFYGKDAFEGLHTLDELMTRKRGGDARRRRRRSASRPAVATAQARVEARPSIRRRCRHARPSSPTDNPVFTPPFLGSRVVKGIALDDIAGYINETALFRNQWEYRPEDGERRRGLQGPHPPDAARAARRGEGAACSSRRSPTATSRPTPTATTSSSGRTTTAAPSGCGSRSPASEGDPFLCIADFVKADRRRPRSTTSAFHLVTMGRRGQRGTPPSCSPTNRVHRLPARARPRRRDGRGARRAVAPPHP